MYRKYAEEMSRAEPDRSRSDSVGAMVGMVGHNKRVLVLGSRTPDLIAALAGQACRVVAFGVDPQVADVAAAHCERMVTGELEALKLASLVPPGVQGRPGTSKPPKGVGEASSAPYDVVVFDESLDHLADPLSVLRAARPLLVPAGCVIACIPNAGHGAMRLSFLAGLFPYSAGDVAGQPESKGRVRFFTRESLGALFEAAGLVLVGLERVTAGIFDTEIALSAEDFSPAVLEEIKADPDSETYRFVANAVVDNGLEAVRLLQARDEEKLRDLAALRVQCGALEADRDRWLSKTQALDAELELWKAQAHALEAERAEWLPRYEDCKLQLAGLRRRAQTAEQRLAEVQAVTARLEAEIASTRSDRDAWRRQAEQLAGARSRISAASLRRRGVEAARTAWSSVPEPYRRVARPALQRLGVPIIGAPTGARASTPWTEPVPEVPPGKGPGGRSGSAPEARERVSVLIPTLNAGAEFARNLDSIAAQEGLGSLEIIVVDSGSSDATRQVAEDRGARVMSIPPGEFNHGGTRNLLAELAEGDVLLLTVQDARLMGRHAIRDLARTLRSEPRVAAVSARAIPRRDADLFAAFLTVSHQEWVTNHYRSDLSAFAQASNPAERRVACLVDNVCAAIDREAWEQVRFRELAFAEDLDFGLRAAQRGWRLLPSFDVGVVHSHNREATYHLRRIVVDRLFLGGLLGDTSFHPASGAGIDAVATAARALLNEIEAASRSASTGVHRVSLDRFLSGVTAALAGKPARSAPTGELASLDELLAGEGEGSGSPALAQMLRADLVGYLQVPDLAQFARAHPAVPVDDAQAFLAKLSTRVIGTAVGDALRADPSPSPLGARLRAGV